MVGEVFTAKGSSLRSAALIRQRGLGFTPQRESPGQSQAALRAHFFQVIDILVQQSEKSLAVAVERLRKAHGDGWSKTEREHWSRELRANRALQIERLRQYARRGLFPLNEHHSWRPIPIFVDRHDTACAVGHLMRQTGRNHAVEEIARRNNHVYVPDVRNGLLVEWVLQSGLTQEEAALIQPGYGPSCRPFADLNLDGVVNESDAEVRDLSDWDFRGMDLTGAFDVMEYAWPCPCNLTGANLSGQNLANAALSYATLTDADFSGTVVTGAWFNTSLGFTKEQLYSTASYQANDLRLINFSSGAFFFDSPNNLTGWDFRGQNLTSAAFYYATLTNADMTGADLRGAQHEINLSGAVSRNAILPDGKIAGLELAAAERLLIRDDDGLSGPLPSEWHRSRPSIPVTIENRFNMANGSVLQLLIDADPWDSLILFGRGIPVQLGGTLELEFADDVNVSTQVGRTLRLFDWAGVAPSGQFRIRGPYIWDITNLYTSGEVTLVAVPEPTFVSIFLVSALVLGTRRRVTIRMTAA
jgi:uncharacterized protein YjbI with pentapeptide repeats